MRQLRHQQNRKYVTQLQSHAIRNVRSDVWICGFWDMLANRQTDRQTHRQTYSSQYSAPQSTTCWGYSSVLTANINMNINKAQPARVPNQSRDRVELAQNWARKMKRDTVGYCVFGLNMRVCPQLFAHKASQLLSLTSIVHVLYTHFSTSSDTSSWRKFT